MTDRNRAGLASSKPERCKTRRAVAGRPAVAQRKGASASPTPIRTTEGGCPLTRHENAIRIGLTHAENSHSALRVWDPMLNVAAP